MTTELAAPAATAVPDLVYGGAVPLDIDAGDVSLSRIKVAQSTTRQAQAGIVTPGQIFASTSEDDANVLFDPKAKNAEGVLIHVLGMTKGKSASIDGSLERYAFNDPAAPPDSWVTYDYIVCAPELEDPFPLKWLMTRSGAPAAKAINTVLRKRQADGPPQANAFRITTAQRKNDKGTYFVPVVSVVEADPKHVEASSQLAAMIASSPTTPVSVPSLPPADAPAI